MFSSLLVEIFSVSNICLICALRGFEFCGESTGSSPVDFSAVLLISFPYLLLYFATEVSNRERIHIAKLPFQPGIPGLILIRTISHFMVGLLFG